MEIRALKYFMCAVEAGSITAAAKLLHVSSSALSRQLSALEHDLGRQLYDRNYKGISLTDYGILLAEYAQEIIALNDKAEEALALPAQSISGSVHIGVGETRAIRQLADAMKSVKDEYPNIDFQLYSGTSIDLMDGLVRGQYDLLLECEVQPHVSLNVFELAECDRWGLLVRKDHPLTQLERITKEDLVGVRLICPRQAMNVGQFNAWLGDEKPELDVVAQYSLGLNSKFLVEQGLGVALVYEGLIDISAENGLAFVPLYPAVRSQHGIVWRKTLPTRQTQVLLDALIGSNAG